MSKGATAVHAARDYPKWADGRGWVATCTCGAEFVGGASNMRAWMLRGDHLAIHGDVKAERRLPA